MLYSTMNMYDVVLGMHDDELPVLTSLDLTMPFTDNGAKYYTGLFTSRPALKQTIREASGVLSAANKMFL